MQFKNMKIEINEHQSLDEVVRELERLGFYAEDEPVHGAENFIHTYEYGGFDFWHSDLHWGELTTIQQLKEMK